MKVDRTRCCTAGLFSRLVTVGIEEDEERLSEAGEKDRVDDAEAKDIVEEHLVEHDDERAGESKWHDEEQHVGPADERGNGENDRLFVDGQDAKHGDEQNAQTERTAETILEKHRALATSEASTVDHSYETHRALQVVPEAEIGHFFQFLATFEQGTADDDRMSETAQEMGCFLFVAVLARECFVCVCVCVPRTAIPLPSAVWSVRESS